ncbi:MAG: ABC transporter permease [Lachnospiraceae bacterium]|nr:ABC transporter permease [Lachnospiraceae bacterium]
MKDQRFILVIVIILLVIIVSIINPKFIRLTNIMTILQQISVLGILTMAMAMLLISGNIDLSIGNMMTLSAVVMATALKNGQSLAVGVVLAILVSMLCGLINGVIITKSKCIPLIITLGTSQVFYGASLLITGGSFMSFNGELEFMRKVALFDIIPLMVLLMVLVVVFVHFLINKTKFGRRIFAIGGNEKNAYLSGVKVDLYKILTYVISGGMVAIAGIVFAARMNSIAPAAGSGYELDALVAAVIGGVTFDGGRGTISGAILGCLLTGVISSAMDILGVHAYWKIAATGTIIVVAVVISNLENIRKRV